MATTKDYKDFILEQLDLLHPITCRPMMGEYLLYYDGILFGGIYDNRLLVKKVENNERYELQEIVPYKNAKPMYFISEIDDKELVRTIVIDTCKGLLNKEI